LQDSDESVQGKTLTVLKQMTTLLTMILTGW